MYDLTSLQRKLSFFHCRCFEVHLHVHVRADIKCINLTLCDLALKFELATFSKERLTNLRLHMQQISLIIFNVLRTRTTDKNEASLLLR